MGMVDARGFNISPNPVGSAVQGFGQGQKLMGNSRALTKDANATVTDDQFKLLSGQMSDPSLSNAERSAASQQRAAIDPERNAKAVQAHIANMSARDKQLAVSVSQGAAQINAVPTWEGRLQAATTRKQQLIADGLPTDETDLFINAVQSGNAEEAQKLLDEGIKAGQLMGVLEGGADGAGGVSEVQSAKIMSNGLVQFIRKDGTVEVKEVSEAEKAKIRAAEERGAEVQGLRSSERTAGSEAQKQSIKTFEKLNTVRTAINNIDNAIQALDDGAETGVVKAKMPSIRSASIRLDNIQKNMGLDVIGSTTFGALSESELKFAISSAMPTNLEPVELRKWLQNKKIAQEKMATYLEGAAEFLGTPGNTVAEWNKAQRELRKAQDAALPGDITEDDIAETMKANNMTREQVLERVNAR